jgi:PAS domain S-box-containing protein
VETTSDAIVITDLERRIVFANPAAVELFGYGDALLGMPVSRLLPEEMRDVVRRHEDLAIEGAPQRYEGFMVRADGERRIVAVTTAPLRELGRVTGIVASLRDVTEARARGAALERSEARYTRLVESASDAIFTVDADGRFTAVNRSLERGVGMTRGELIGEPASTVVDPRDHGAAGALLRETFQGQRGRGSLRYRARDGEVRHGSVITSPIIEHGKITGVLGIMRDVTDDQRLAEQLLQQEKLAAIGQLVSGVAHELNNPLAGVMAYAELLIASPSAIQDPEARRALETIRHEAMRASKIVSHLLTFARRQPAERVEVELNGIIEDTLELRRYAIRTAQIELDVSLDPALPRTWADPFQLQQVLLNLLGNAEQALTEWTGARRIGVRSWREAGRLLIAVSDTGPGIPVGQRDRIFNPFFTTKPVGEGTGLGLSISDGIVREHGGRIRVESQPGEGATFVVDLPIAPPPAGGTSGSAKRLTSAIVPADAIVYDEVAAGSKDARHVTIL